MLRIGGHSRYAGVYQGIGQLIALAVQFEERIIPFRSEIDSLTLRGNKVHAVVTVSIRVPPGDVFQAQLARRSPSTGEGRVAELSVPGVDQRSSTGSSAEISPIARRPRSCGRT